MGEKKIKNLENELLENEEQEELSLDELEDVAGGVSNRHNPFDWNINVKPR